MIVTDHHQAGERAAGLPDPAPGNRATTRSPRSAGPRSPGSWRAAARGRGPRPRCAIGTRVRSRPRPRRAGDGRRRGAAGRREPLAGEARAGRDAAGAAAGAAGADRGLALRADAAGRGRSRLPAGAADQRRGPPLPGRCRGRAAAHRRRGAGRGRSPPSWAAPTRSGGRPSARSTPPPRRRGASCPRSCAKRRAWCSPARTGTPAWSGSSPRGWSSATTGRSSSISLDGEGGGRGSGRSIPGFDLLAALRGLLRAPRELRRPPRRRRALRCGPRTSRPSARRSPPTRPRCSAPSELRRTERIDAMVGGVGLGLELAEELRPAGPVRDGQPGRAADGALGPGQRRADDGGGQARPLQPPQRLPPGARRRLRPLRPRGRGRGAGRRRGAARGQPLERLGRAARRPARALPARTPTAPRPPSGCTPASARTTEWWRRFEAELARDLERGGRLCSATTGAKAPRPARRVVRGGGSATVAIAELVSSGAGVLAVCADASRRAALAAGRHRPGPLQRRRRPRRLPRCGAEALARPARPGRRRPGADRLRGARAASRQLAAGLRARRPRRPAARSAEARRCRRGAGDGRARPASCTSSGREAELAFALAVLDEQLASRERGRRASSASLRERGRGERRARSLRAGARRRRRAPARARGRGALLPRPAELDLVAGEPERRRRRRRGRILRGDRSGALSRVPCLPRTHLGGPAIPRKTQTAVEHSELLADLFAVVEEFDSAPRPTNGSGNGAVRRRRHRGRGGDDRPRRGRARLRLRLRAPRRPAALLRRRVHHPPGRGRPGLRRACGSTPRPSARRCCTTRSRTPAPASTRSASRVRRGDRPAGRRRHQADRDDLREPRRAPGRELPQDDGGDGHRRQGDPDQAGRPPPQHAHARRPAEAEADGEVARDAGDLRAARPPARDPRDQVGARGPRLRHPAPAQVRRNQAAGRPAARRARELRLRRRRVPLRGAGAGRDRGRDLRPRQALLLDLHEDGEEGPRVQRDLRPHRDAGDRRLGQGLLRRDRRHPLALEAAARALQGLRRDAEGEHVPGAAHDRDRARGQAAGDPDPDRGDAQAGRVRDRRPRRLQRGRAARDPEAGEDDLAAAAGRGRGRTGPGRVPRIAQGRPLRGRGLRLHPEGRSEEPLRRLDPARLRLRGPHRRRPPLRRRQGQRQHRAAALPAALRRHRRGADREAETRPLARLAEAGADQPRPQQDPRLVQRGTPRGRRARRPRERSRKRCASAACRCRRSPARRCSPT